MDFQLLMLARAVHVEPESEEMKIDPLLVVAAIFVPSLDDAIDEKLAGNSVNDPDTPESVERYMPPPPTSAATFVPSSDKVTPVHARADPVDDQEAPESSET
jgi:hypothetical protein